MKKVDRTQILYINIVLDADGKVDMDRSVYWRVHYTDPKAAITIPLTLAELKTSKRGTVWECWMAQIIKAHAKMFPHAVLYVHVMRTCIYIVTGIKGGIPYHAVRYMHNRSDIVDVFDKKGKAAAARFLKEAGGELPIVLSPGEHRPREGNRPYRPVHKNTTGKNTRIVTHGALRRALDARLIVPGVATSL